jgi:hypothetical protein
MFQKINPQRNTFTFTGKGGILISSDFDSGNLAACQESVIEAPIISAQD